VTVWSDPSVVTAIVSPAPETWLCQVIDRTGAAKAFVVPKGLEISPRLNGAAQATFTIEFADASAPDVAVGSRAVALWRGSTLRFAGQITGLTWSGDTTSGRKVAVTARDPLAVLERRFLGSGVSYAATDAGAIVTALLALANAQEETHLQMGTVATSVNRDRTYDLAKQIGEAVLQLAEVQQGFWFRVDAIASGAKFGELVILYPDSGSDRPGARWEFGEGTRDNLDSYSVADELPVNDVIGLGADSGDGTQLTATAEDATSKSERGMWGKSYSATDVSEQATLNAHVAGEIRADPPRTFTVQPISTPVNESAAAPRMWVDFDIGDTGRLSIPGGGVGVEDLEVRIIAATVAVSDDAEVEQIKNLQLQEVPA
jgi:hypothetical protein